MMIKVVALSICLFFIGQEVDSQQETVSKWTLRQELLLRNSKYTLDPPNIRSRIKTNIVVLSVDEINEDNMEFSVHFLLSLTWSDYRLVYGDQLERIKKLPISNPQSIWTPNVCFIDDKEDETFTKVHLDHPITIYPDGKVLYKKRVSITVPCDVNRHLLPKQAQKCTIRWKLCDATADEDVQLVWEKDPLRFTNYIYLNPYSLDKVVTYAEPSTVDARLRFQYATFYLSKDITHYFGQIYGPFSVIIFLSWLQLWLNNEKYSTSRTLIGLTAVALCTLISYKANHFQTSCFASTSFIFTFSLLIETVFILHMEQKEKTVANDENSFKETNGRFMFFKKLRLLKGRDIDKIIRVIYPILYILFCVTYFSYAFVRRDTGDINNDAGYEFKVNITVSPYENYSS